MEERARYTSFDELQEEGVEVNADQVHDPAQADTVARRLRRVSSHVLARTRRSLSVLEPRRDMGFSAAVTCVVGECAGTGMLTLPKVVAESGWVGIVFLVLLSLTAVYTGHLLTRCWAMVLHRHPADHNYVPYQAISYRAFGHRMRSLVTSLHCLSLFCVGTMALVLCSQTLHSLFSQVDFYMSACYWMLVLSVFCCPLTWLGGSEYMSTVVVIVGMGSVLSSLLILTTTTIVSLDTPARPTNVPSPTLWTVLSGVGKISYTFAGHAAYPNIQSNVYRREHISWVIIAAYFVLMLTYFPLAIVPLYTLGAVTNDDVQLSLLQLITDRHHSVPALVAARWLIIISQILMCCHLVTNIIISLNPFMIEAEKMVGVGDRDRDMKQTITRAMLYSTCLFIAMSLPNFAAIIALIGSSAEMLLSYVLPCVFYERLCMIEGQETGRTNPMYVKLLNHKIIIVGLLLGLGGTFVALATLFGDDTFVLPCYSRFFHDDPPANATTAPPAGAY